MATLHLDLSRDARRRTILADLRGRLSAEQLEELDASTAAAGVPDRHHHDIGEVNATIDFLNVSDRVKQDMRAAYPFGLFAVPRSECVRVHASSGTTGQATVVGYTKDDLQVWGDCFARGIYMLGGGEDSVVQVSYGYGLFTGGLGAHFGAEAAGAMVVPMSTGNTKRQIQIMKDCAAHRRYHCGNGHEQGRIQTHRRHPWR